MAQTRPVRTEGSRLAHAVGPAQVTPVVAGIPWLGFGEFDASVQGWINHVRYADTWGLREHVLGSLLFTRRP